jgi:hypothetical protein
MNTRAWILAAGGVLLLSACASSNMVAQWSDPQFAGQPPPGAKVMVACEAQDFTLRRVCVDRMSAQLLTLGVLPVPAPDADGAPIDDAALLDSARSAGAMALLRTTIKPETAAISTVPSFGIGIGGFGGGYGRGGGVGVGMSAPLGGVGPAATGYGASAALTDVISGRLMWSGNASASPSSDVNQQLGSMAAQLLDGAVQSGMFARS